MFEKIGMSARAMPYKRRPNKRGKRQIQWKLTRCVFIVPSGKRPRLPVTCIQPLELTMRQATSHWQCYYLVQETIVICLSFNGLMHGTLGGTEGGRPGGLEGLGE